MKRPFIASLLVAILTSTALAQPAKKIPVIIDTDIGSDIDDTWALAFALRCPELDIKLVVSDRWNAVYRAKLIAKLLMAAGRSDIPIGVGVDPTDKPGNQSKWVEGFDMNSYPGKLHADGVQALIDAIMRAPEPVTLICLGPLPNIGEALRREPRIASKARFVGMYGAVRWGYERNKVVGPEANVRNDIKSCQAAFTAPWEITITPLDTCDQVRLSGQVYARLRDSRDPLAAAVMENYRIWKATTKAKWDPEKQSSVLYDTVAIYLAFSTHLLTMERLPIAVMDKGLTVIDEAAGKPMNVATHWKDYGAFERLLVERIAGK